LEATLGKVSEKPLKKPALKVTLRGLRYTFALTDVAVIVAIGDKVSAGFFPLWLV